MNKKGFTLVELLAVIVILAVILVIAVPKITDTINSTKEASLKSSVQMVAASVETQNSVAQTLGNTFNQTGNCIGSGAEWAGLNSTDYSSCTYSITDGVATVRIKGSTTGKFANWSKVGYTAGCSGTRSSVTCVNNADSVTE